MDLLFIDANIYLRFYDNNQPEYKKLLKTVVEIKDTIFITKQIVNEVNRNKLAVFQMSCSDSLADDSIKSKHLPEHFDSAEKETIKEWNKKIQALRIESNKLIKEQTTIFEDLLLEISLSKDKVSSGLIDLFSSAKIFNEKQLQRANERKQIGNPPGKAKDPLGDQISWEQLLDDIPKVTDLWIISNDSDYLSSYKDKCYLNPFLSSEIYNIAKNIKTIRCFTKLADGLKDFDDHLSTKLVSIPKEEDLKEISRLEILPSPSGSVSGYIDAVPQTWGNLNNLLRSITQDQCPACHSVTTISPYVRNYGTGAFEYIYVCHICGKQWNKIISSE